MRALAVASFKGGTGKSTVAVHLAHGLALAGRRTLLLDLDPQASATRYTGAEAPDGAPALEDVLRGRGSLRAASVVSSWHPKLFVAPASIALAGLEGELRDGSRLRAVLEASASAFDVVVADTPPGLSRLVVAGIGAARGVLAVVELKPLSLGGLAHLVNVAGEVGSRLVGVVPSRVPPHRTRLAEEVSAELAQRFNVLPAIHERTAVAEAAGHHLPVARYAPRSPAAEDFAALVVAVARLSDSRPQSRKASNRFSGKTLERRTDA